MARRRKSRSVARRCKNGVSKRTGKCLKKKRTSSFGRVSSRRRRSRR